MKKSHIFALGIIGLAVGIIIVTKGNSSNYVNFRIAYDMGTSGNSRDIHIVGELKKDLTGKVIGIGSNVNGFSFILIDDEGKQGTVLYNDPMPADMLQSEKVVVIGHYEKENFIAKKILLKCPSKYQSQKISETSKYY